MTTAITETNGTRQSALAQSTGWNASQIDVLKNQVAKGCSDDELMLFGMVCKRTGLDPFQKQIYAISRSVYNPETKKKEPRMSIQTSIDGFRKIADQSGEYAGSITYWCGKDKVWTDVWLESEPPLAAKTEVYKKGCDRPFVGVARFDSYKQEFNGKLSNMWANMPDLMIGKCSEALALRKAFPASLSGLYTSDEMMQAENSGSAKHQSSKPSVTLDGLLDKLDRQDHSARVYEFKNWVKENTPELYGEFAKAADAKIAELEKEQAMTSHDVDAEVVEEDA